MQTCRFCHGLEVPSRLVKYAARHYAHFACYLDNGKVLADLHKWQIEQFPYMLLIERELVAEASKLCNWDIETAAVQIIPAMNVNTIKARIAEITALVLARDDKVAHGKEDALYQDVLRAIARGSCTDPRACAKLVITTQDLSFGRW